jgi:hypothetical protein
VFKLFLLGSYDGKVDDITGVSRANALS